MTPLIDPAIQAHIDLKRALAEHGITKVAYKNDLSAFMKRDAGPFADASYFTSIVEIIIPFTNPAAVVAVFCAARPIILKWIDARAGRSVTCETEVSGRKHSISVRGNNDIDQAAKVLMRLIDHAEQRDERPLE
jgi:hypothetical protein